MLKKQLEHDLHDYKIKCKQLEETNTTLERGIREITESRDANHDDFVSMREQYNGLMNDLHATAIDNRKLEDKVRALTYDVTQANRKCHTRAIENKVLKDTIKLQMSTVLER